MHFQRAIVNGRTWAVAQMMSCTRSGQVPKSVMSSPEALSCRPKPISVIRAPREPGPARRCNALVGGHKEAMMLESTVHMAFQAVTSQCGLQTQMQASASTFLNGTA